MIEKSQHAKGGGGRLIDRLEQKSKDPNVFLTAFSELTDPADIKRFYYDYVQDLIVLHHPYAETEAKRRLTALLQNYRHQEIVNRWKTVLHLTKTAEELEQEIAVRRRIDDKPDKPPKSPVRGEVAVPEFKDTAVAPAPPIPDLPPPPQKDPPLQKKKIKKISAARGSPKPPENKMLRIRLLPELKHYRPAVDVVMVGLDVLNTADLVQQFFWELVDEQVSFGHGQASAESTVRSRIEQVLKHAGETARADLWRRALEDGRGLVRLRQIVSNPRSFKTR